MNHEMSSYQSAIDDIREIIRNGRTAAYQAVSATQILTNWNVGKRIIEEEQHGKSRAEYGKQLIAVLSNQLT